MVGLFDCLLHVSNQMNCLDSRGLPPRFLPNSGFRNRLESNLLATRTTSAWFVNDLQEISQNECI